MTQPATRMGDVLLSGDTADRPAGEQQLAPLADVHASVAGVLKDVNRQALRTALLKTIADTLHEPLFDTLATAWIKADAIVEYRDTKKYPPDSRFLVELVDHTFESKHEPSVEILVHGALVAKLPFEVALDLKLKAFQLEIRGGRILAVHSGTLQASGHVSLGGQEFYTKELAPVEIPGSVSFGEGIVI